MKKTVVMLLLVIAVALACISYATARETEKIDYSFKATKLGPHTLGVTCKDGTIPKAIGHMDEMLIVTCPQ